MSILFIDNNLGLDHAIRLAQETEVFYWSEWRTGYMKAEEWLVGYGFEKIAEGFRKVKSYLENRDVDLVFIADSGFGDVGDYFRERGIPVFGPSSGSDRLELWRDWAAEAMNAYGIKTPEYETVVGLEELMEVVKREKEVFVKVSTFRGNFETCRVTGVEDLESVLQSSGLGPVLNRLPFLVSKPIEGVEVGIDMWWNGREFVRPYHLGCEVKGYNACFGKWVNESIWDEDLKKFETLLQDVAPLFRGEISLEAILNENGLHVLDITPRLARPAGSLMYYSLSGSYTDIVKAVATGETPEVSLTHAYTAQVGVEASEKKRWSHVGANREGMALTARGVMLGEDIWIAPHFEDGVVLYFMGKGEGLESAVKEAYDRAGDFVMESGDFHLIGGAWAKFKEKYIPKMEQYGAW